MKARRVATAALVAGGAALTLGALGGALTRIGPWYRRLRKPAWTPPDVAFPIVWTTIFTLAAVAGARAWLKAETPADRRRTVRLFTLNGVLNAAWSLLFFTLRRPDLALVESVLLWFSILALVVGLWPISILAAVLLLPYLAWTAVAVALNARIVQLNGKGG